jgi:hypothetical protein
MQATTAVYGSLSTGSGGDAVKAIRGFDGDGMRPTGAVATLPGWPDPSPHGTEVEMEKVVARRTPRLISASDAARSMS